MEIIKFFNLQKNKKTSDNAPDYRISFKTNESFVEAGACWVKSDKNGNKFLSCKLSDVWKDHTDERNTRKGWHIEEDKKDRAFEEAMGIKEVEENNDVVGF